MNGQFFEFSDAQQSLLHACEEKRDNHSQCIRSLCSKHKVYYVIIHHALQKLAIGAATIKSSSSLGRQQHLDETE